MAPKDIIEQIIILLKNTVSFIYSTLLTGNIGEFILCSDLYKAKAEINMINMLDDTIKGFYKPYPEFNKDIMIKSAC